MSEVDHFAPGATNGGRGVRALMVCPHCNAPMRIEKSQRLTPICKHADFQCLNAECGFSVRMALEPLHELSPSAAPNPDVFVKPRPPGFPVTRYPSPLGRDGHDPPDDRQIAMFTG